MIVIFFMFVLLSLLFLFCKEYCVFNYNCFLLLENILNILLEWVYEGIGIIMKCGNLIFEIDILRVIYEYLLKKILR